MKNWVVFSLFTLIVSVAWACGLLDKDHKNKNDSATFSGKIPADWSGDVDWDGSAFKLTDE